MNDQLIYTFGYEGRELEELRDLARNLSAVVIDVRMSPLSRSKGWNRHEMDQVIPEYVWVQDFGNINFNRPELPITIKDLEHGFDQVYPALAAGRSVILVCYEEDPSTCHRRDVADFLSEKTWIPVAHLMKHGVQLSLF